MKCLHFRCDVISLKRVAVKKFTTDWLLGDVPMECFEFRSKQEEKFNIVDSVEDVESALFTDE